ncbi:MAG: class I tRNA ligase family protein, partial [Actinobacteria bacterium]|nr:class I tRNA ligase family protein [Actinomycetota bacterium]
RKMSKHLGNVLEPIGLMDRHGADAVRWFMLAAGSAWQSRRVSDDTINEVVRKTLLTYWNTASFLSLYGRIAEFDYENADIPPVELRSSLDRWAISRANELIVEVEAALDQFDTQRAGRVISRFVDDLSNWYVRRSRRRFWDGDPAALATLHESLQIVTLLMAPFTPFITERVWTDLFASEETESVHLAAWPKADTSTINSDLHTHVDLVRRLVELGRAARASSKMKTRQPLRRALVAADGWNELPADLVDEITEEINVMTAVALDVSDSDLVEVSVKANFRELGKRFGKRTPDIAAAIVEADAEPLVKALRENGSATVIAGCDAVIIEPGDVVSTETPRQGWAVATDAGETVALDLTLDDELRAIGLARDVIREIQEARKNLGFEVTDRIEVQWQADGDLATALRKHASEVSNEVLATSFQEADVTADGGEPVHQIGAGAGRALITRSEPQS